MSALRRFSVVTVALTAAFGCSDERAQPDKNLPPFAATGAGPDRPPMLDSVTHIRVTAPRDDPRTRSLPSTITDSVAIDDLVAFVESRRASWRPLSERGPRVIEGPFLFIDFYRGAALLATLTYRGPVELGIEGRHGQHFQVLSPSDANVFAKLVGVPIKVIAVPPRNAM